MLSTAEADKRMPCTQPTHYRSQACMVENKAYSLLVEINVDTTDFRLVLFMKSLYWTGNNRAAANYILLDSSASAIIF